MKIDADCANCASGRDLRFFGRRANLFGVQNGRYFGRKEEFPENEEKEDSPKERAILGIYRVFREFYMGGGWVGVGGGLTK